MLNDAPHEEIVDPIWDDSDDELYVSHIFRWFTYLSGYDDDKLKSE